MQRRAPRQDLVIEGTFVQVRRVLGWSTASASRCRAREGAVGCGSRIYGARQAIHCSTTPRLALRAVAAGTAPRGQSRRPPRRPKGFRNGCWPLQQGRPPTPPPHPRCSPAPGAAWPAPCTTSSAAASSWENPPAGWAGNGNRRLQSYFGLQQQGPGGKLSWRRTTGSRASGEGMRPLQKPTATCAATHPPTWVVEEHLQCRGVQMAWHSALVKAGSCAG